MSEPDTAVFIERFRPGDGDGPRVAVKDLIDVAGSVTTAGSPAVARRSSPAVRDAPVVAALRGAGVQIVGKTNLHELAFGVSGVNPFYGTPENPRDPGRVPGGSSSGSAVAVARGEADFALGSDTGGSIRIPAACCGVVGLKTTYGRLDTSGVFPLAPSYDTVGPMAASVRGVGDAMALLEPGFAPAVAEGVAVRLASLGDVAVEPEIDAAVSSALEVAELDLAGVAEVPGWAEAWHAQQVLLSDEALSADGWLLEATGGEGISPETLERFSRARVAPEALDLARTVASRFVPLLTRIVSDAVLVLPTLPCRPPGRFEPVRGFNVLTAPVNLAGLPAVSVPVPVKGRPPTGLQLVGAAGSEELLVALAGRIESAVNLPPL